MGTCAKAYKAYKEISKPAPVSGPVNYGGRIPNPPQPFGSTITTVEEAVDSNICVQIFDEQREHIVNNCNT